MLDVTQDVQSRWHSGTTRCPRPSCAAQTSADVLVREARCRDRFERPAFGVEQPDRTRAVGDVGLERADGARQRLGHRRPREDELEHAGLGLGERDRALAVGDVAEVADEAADRRFVQLVGPRGLDPPPSVAVGHVELGGDGLVGVVDERGRCSAMLWAMPLGVEVVGEAESRSSSSNGCPNNVFDRGADVLHRAASR